ncbi:MAG TPA: DEAD/DEAH box helicase family protein [Hydrogenophaga sp.]|uniref:DEAD/DEAH box helicase n=1 Tax=Hydrogenophaga sp. TaxID=1904254 RepID=UPI002B8F8545|nr:DEAD/DEAH box helicase family protein [Hydrogenophaga sp.]HMN93247.1 DEAD/DEAH box helicase family protein [Hydrogenophaga sp.]HMP11719.1 DEAD/DEAH box helicase family protein [Hydrogenophaga sp.]
MATLKLKRYQETALDDLDKFLRAARLSGPRSAFEAQTGYGYNTEPFGETPCVCLRIPTGGGKTLMAAHAVGRMAREWPGDTAHPLVLWLVPSDTIRSQTLAALATPGHPFREALAQGCGESVRVCDLDEMATLSPQDFDSRAVVVVATIQSFRIEDTEQRNVYAFSEAFEPHFRGLPAHALRGLHELPNALVTVEEAASAKAGREMLARFVGQPRWSLANWLALRRPYVIVDEAHNTKTERSFEALKRLNPALILELTATPVPKRTNVLFHVSAQQLQAEHMIKMPIALIEHTRGWQAAVFDAVQNQRLLEAEAQQEEATTGAYIRPIVLLQAQNSTDPVNVDVLRTHLVDELEIPADQVKVATGTQRELDGLDLSARDCPVRYIITVQALREGWDCPFAYILCSVQSIRSATAVEQLLGRVLRMPYARQRSRPALNKAYAHVTEAETGLAANALADRLIDGMGFDPLDMASMIAPQLPLDGMDAGPLFAQTRAEPVLPSLSVDLPAGKALPQAVADAVAQGLATVSTDGERQRVQLRGEVGEAVAIELVAAQRGKQREQVTQQIERHNALVAGAQAPCNRGERFAPVPRLCYRPSGSQGELQLLEREAVTEEMDLNLLVEPVSLEGFAMVEQGTLWEVYLDGERLRVGRGDVAQLPLDGVEPTIRAEDLARWLSEELQHPARNVARDLTPAHLRSFVLATVLHLMNDRHIPLGQLARHQYPLVQRLALRIAELRDKATKLAFRQRVLDGGWTLEASAAHAYRFDPACYPVPANKRYRGKFRFSKHFYPVLSDLEDGGEEWRCALAIDEHPMVRRWVRNLDSDPVAGFWLPTSRGRFYPDFVCELVDGRLFVAEYKGEHLRNQTTEIEKGQVGKVWAANSGERALFAMLFKQERGMGLTQQIDASINRR